MVKKKNIFYFKIMKNVFESGHFYRVGRPGQVRGNKKYFNFGPTVRELAQVGTKGDLSRSEREKAWPYAI